MDNGPIGENYQFDATSRSEQTISEYVDEHLEGLASLRRPDAIIYLLLVDGNVEGMGAIRKLRNEIGEIKRMYIRPVHGRKGYGKQMLNNLLEAGREFGCSSSLLDTAKFMTAAQHLHRSTGFKERGEYRRAKYLRHLSHIGYLWGKKNGNIPVQLRTRISYAV